MNGQSGIRRRLGTFAGVVREIRCDVAAARERDPAARGVSSLEILLNWPGVHALLAHRVSHALHAGRVPMLPRAMALATRAITNIEIHPAASIGQGLFIDHGTGVVVGGTAVIGANVKLYQGVTLGAFSFDKDADGQLVRHTKRHPTIEDDVVVYAGATILGGDTIISRGSVIGGNVWLTHSVPPNARVLQDSPRLRIITPEEAAS